MRMHYITTTHFLRFKILYTTTQYRFSLSISYRVKSNQFLYRGDDAVGGGGDDFNLQTYLHVVYVCILIYIMVRKIVVLRNCGGFCRLMHHHPT